VGKHLRGRQPQRAQRQHGQKTPGLISSTALVTQGSSPLHVTAAMAGHSCDIFWGRKRRRCTSPRVETHLQTRSAPGCPEPGFARFALPPATPCRAGSVARTPAPDFSNFRLKRCQRAAGGLEKGRRN